MDLKCGFRPPAAVNLRREAFNAYEHPSFSSTLLDSIYRSIDESSHDLRPSSRSRSQSRQKEFLFEELGHRTKIGRNSSSRVDRWIQNEDRRRSLPPETTSEFVGMRSSHRRRSLGSSSSESSVSDPRPPKSDSGGKSAKSRAMKLYGELKRMKQPISPGGKLATFLNSLFSSTANSKKQRLSSTPNSSCLKRPSSARQYDDCGKRSVRFCPIDEDFGSKARDLLRKYQQREEMVDVVDDDDCESCCSSDLFELEIGVDKYCEELPVYETTRVDANRVGGSRRTN